jgi:hypothetical protein
MVNAQSARDGGAGETAGKRFHSISGDASRPIQTTPVRLFVGPQYREDVEGCRRRQLPESACRRAWRSRRLHREQELQCRRDSAPLRGRQTVPSLQSGHVRGSRALDDRAVVFDCQASEDAARSFLNSGIVDIISETLQPGNFCYAEHFISILAYLGFGICNLVFGIWHLVFRVWYLQFGMWCLAFGIWCLVFAIWCLVFGIWYLVLFGIYHTFRAEIRKSRRPQTGLKTSKVERNSRVVWGV